MKSNARFQLDDKWWKNETPRELGKAADKLEKALKDFSTADQHLNLEADDDQLSSAELAELAKCGKLLDAVASAGSDAMKEIEALARKEEDKARKKDLENTVDALKRALPKAIEEKRQEYDSYDGDGVGTPLVSPAAHTAYLKRMMPRLKRREHNFGFGLVGNDPTAQRFLFSTRKAARSLATNIRNDTQPRAISWGRAVGGGSYPGGEYGGMTLVLTLEGKKIPSFARRVRVMLKALGISMFNKIVVLRDGAEEDSSDESEAEVALEEVEAEALDDLDADGEGGDAPAAPRVAVETPAGAPEPATAGETPAGAAPSGTAPGPAAPRPNAVSPEPHQPDPLKLKWLEMRNAVAAKMERAIAIGHDDPRVLAKHKTIWLMAQEAAENKKYAQAIKAATAIQRFLADFNPPPEDAFDRWMRKRKKLYPAMMKLIKEGKGDPWRYRGAWGMSEFYHDDNNHEEALKSLNMLARFIAEGEAAPDPKDLIPSDPAGQAELERDLRDKLSMMLDDAADLEEVYSDKKERKTFMDKIDQAAHAIDEAITEPKETTKSRDFMLAFSNFTVMEKLIREARKHGKKEDRQLKTLRLEVSGLDERVNELAHLVNDKSLRDLFKEMNEARGSVLKFLRFEDVYGALAKLGAYAESVEDLEKAAKELEGELAPA